MKKISFITVLLGLTCNAYALDYEYGNWKFALNAEGMIGFLENRTEKVNLIDDWDIKGQIFYNLNDTQRFGAVYSIDAACVENDEYVHDAFVLFEDKDIGRTELGLTHSIARKMGLGLPDVGSLRIHDQSILYKKLDLKKVLISDPTMTTGHDALRLNLATSAHEYGQFGFSMAGGSDEYDYSFDIAYKLRQPLGKLKSAYSVAFSYMNNLDEYEENSFTPAVTADWRGQMALGINLQYNSWIWGTSARLIYDENPVAKKGDGLFVGTGVSYDFLQSSISLTYMYSNTKLWEHKDKITQNDLDGDYLNTVLASFRYKYSPNTSLFMSGGIADTTPFFAVGLKSGF